MKTRVCLWAMGMIALGLGARAQTRDLTFEDRIHAQEAIERVYGSHRTWPAANKGGRPSLTVLLPEGAIRSKVADYLEKSNALERIWGRPITAEQLQAEIMRMARETRQPSLLTELFDALDDDPFLIAECLARPLLADRRLRNAHAGEHNFHERGFTGRAVPLLMTSEPSERNDSTSIIAGTPISQDVMEPTETESFDQWWRRVHTEFSSTLVSPIDISMSLPRIAEACSDDTWSGMPFGGPIGRTEHSAIWTGVEMIVWGGFENSGAIYSPATDTWRPTSLSASPTARGDHTAVWTGHEMLVWGGFGSGEGQPVRLSSGGRYDPMTDTWSPISNLLAPQARALHTAIWSGTEMLIWGGNIGGATNTGGLYDPSTDTWRVMGTGPGVPGAREEHTAVWTGKEMIVFGGLGDAIMREGGAYDPSTNTWRIISTGVNLPAARNLHTAIWTGTHMIVWGGRVIEGGGYVNTGGRYNPSSDSWLPISTSGGAPSGRAMHSATWTGTEMIVWGGYNGFTDLGTGGRYDPVLDLWTPTTSVGSPQQRRKHTAVWTGSEMIVWGSNSGLFDVGTGGRYDPASDSWMPTSTGADLPSLRTRHVAVWTGAEMIVWGGYDGVDVLATGGRYDPATNQWRPTSIDANTPVARQGHTAIWSGEEMIVWGGRSATSFQSTGARYDPITDSWRATSMGANVPQARWNHGAVWTGDEMIVWGGDSSGTHFNSGGRYAPRANAWTPVGVGANVPSPRTSVSLVWTGSRMIVWGGRNALGLQTTGGRYDPSTDTWSPTSTSSAPSPRSDTPAIWTGRAMIVWGGLNGGLPINTGRLYDPVLDTWTATSGIAAPLARGGHSAVWTGSEMIVWGGSLAGLSPTFTGGRYDPVANTWRATNTSGSVPSPRTGVPGVWTGSEMLEWGGGKPDGSRYCAVSTCPVHTWYRDADHDGYGVESDNILSCDPPPPSMAAAPGDCRDADPLIHPGALESCDGVDENCDDSTDEGGAALCEDGNLCTDNLCKGAAGCANSPNTAPCDDGNACTVADQCASSACQPGRILIPKVECNDHNACTQDYCDPDVGCMHSPIICRDNDRNTIDSCDPRRGCVFTQRHRTDPLPDTTIQSGSNSRVAGD